MALPPSASLVILSWSCNILVCLVAGGVGGRRSLLALGGVHPVRHLAEGSEVIHVPLYTLFVILFTKQNMGCENGFRAHGVITSGAVT